MIIATPFMRIFGNVKRLIQRIENQELQVAHPSEVIVNANAVRKQFMIDYAFSVQSSVDPCSFCVFDKCCAGEEGGCGIPEMKHKMERFAIDKMLKSVAHITPHRRVDD